MGVTSDELYRVAIDAAMEHPGVDVYSFAEGWEAARVRGKWFMLTTLLRGERILVMKAPPEDVLALQEAIEEIGPGYHMNKKHWFTVRAGERITPEFVEELVADAYATIVML